MSNLPSDLSPEALRLYRSGDLEKAIATQQEVIAQAARQGVQHAKHYLALAMFLFEAGRFPEALDWLQKAAWIWPSDPEIAENAGVLLQRLGRLPEAIAELERALALGSQSLNVLDCLCNCYGLLKDAAKVQELGRRVLEAKNRASLRAGVKYPLPHGPPPRFEPLRRRDNVIAYSLWGSAPRYFEPLLENLKIAPHLFPAWTIRVYADNSVPGDVIDRLKRGGADIVDKSGVSGEPFYAKLLWRFEAANDSGVRRFLIRDADSLLSVKERVAVDAWLASDRYFHIMRDFFTHTDLILAGMWGGVANTLPNLEDLRRAYQSPVLEGRTADQRFLSEMVWPTVSQSCIIHDSVFTGCLNSVPFPPYGDLLPGHHVGQNAFIHFRQTSSA